MLIKTLPEILLRYFSHYFDHHIATRHQITNNFSTNINQGFARHHPIKFIFKPISVFNHFACQAVHFNHANFIRAGPAKFKRKYGS